jgi:hypothetical protein
MCVCSFLFPHDIALVTCCPCYPTSTTTRSAGATNFTDALAGLFAGLALGPASPTRQAIDQGFVARYGAHALCMNAWLRAQAASGTAGDVAALASGPYFDWTNPNKVSPPQLPTVCASVFILVHISICVSLWISVPVPAPASSVLYALSVSAPPS